MQELDPALSPVSPRLHPGEEYSSSRRRWQGIPGLERTSDGHLYATWYSGGDGEGPDNYVLVVRSEDDGSRWSEPVLVIDPPGRVRAYDPCLWTDPSGRLWLFWAQSEGWFDGRAGVWAICYDAPAAAYRTWTEPRRLGHGVMMNKPTVLRHGDWLLPTALWERSVWMPEGLREGLPYTELDDQRFSGVLATHDAGETFVLRGLADVPRRTFDEHMIVERTSGTLWMLVRTTYGIGECFSHDHGRTWSLGHDSGLGGPCSRFFIRRLASGALLLVNHYKHTGRNNLTALVSDDEGRSWPYRLLLDPRDDVSYPDGFEADDGTIYIIYDRDRYGAREILFATFTEQDVLAGADVSGRCRLQQVVNRAAP